MLPLVKIASSSWARIRIQIRRRNRQRHRYLPGIKSACAVQEAGHKRNWKRRLVERRSARRRTPGGGRLKLPGALQNSAMPSDPLYIRRKKSSPFPAFARASIRTAWGFYWQPTLKLPGPTSALFLIHLPRRTRMSRHGRSPADLPPVGRRRLISAKKSWLSLWKLPLAYRIVRAKA